MPPLDALGAAGGGGVDAVSSHLGSRITTPIFPEPHRPLAFCVNAGVAGPVPLVPNRPAAQAIDVAILLKGGVHHGRRYARPVVALSCGQFRPGSAEALS